LLGAGYGFEGAGVNGDAKTLWNAGAGVRIGLSQNWELDGRYRYVNHFDNHWNDSESHVITAGISYRF
jgi:opacity protein-like surface antigen